MSWIYLLIAGILEIGWPVGLKIAQRPEHQWLGSIIATICISLSGYALWMAQKHIPLGTAYAVWTGIGVVGTFVVGVIFFNDVFSTLRLTGVTLIVGGVIVLKLATGTN